MRWCSDPVSNTLRTLQYPTYRHPYGYSSAGPKMPIWSDSNSTTIGAASAPLVGFLLQPLARVRISELLSKKPPSAVPMLRNCKPTQLRCIASRFCIFSHRRTKSSDHFLIPQDLFPVSYLCSAQLSPQNKAGLPTYVRVSGASGHTVSRPATKRKHPKCPANGLMSVPFWKFPPHCVHRRSSVIRSDMTSFQAGVLWSNPRLFAWLFPDSQSLSFCHGLSPTGSAPVLIRLPANRMVRWYR